MVVWKLIGRRWKEWLMSVNSVTKIVAGNFIWGNTPATGATEKERCSDSPRDMSEPEWATELIEKIMAYKKRSQRPKVKWIRRNRRSTSGICYFKSITICLGNDESEWKQILLHELAHWLGRRKWHHNKKFWLLLKDLLIYCDVYTEEYKKREFEYMKKSQNYL